jgi:ethanolamine utilization protein EutA
VIEVERKVITSVGIDIGTTTSHLVFSELVLEKDEFSRSKKFRIVERNIKHRGRIFFTPLKKKNQEIDVEKLMPLLFEEYERAGYAVSQIDTGAVIVTGESARKENAELIVERLAQESGKFVAATAGPNFESVISAHGSGAVEYSKENSCKLIHTDIGGGTSNIAVIDNGEIVKTACVNVGGRQLAFGAGGEVVRLEPAGLEVIEELGYGIGLGDIPSQGQKEGIADTLAFTLVDVLLGTHQSDLSERLMMTESLPVEALEDDILYSFSGGVAEYIYGKESRDFEDLGKLLGERLRELCEERGLTLVETSEKIRATVIGACEFTLQVSGSTTYRSPELGLPIRNLPVVVVNVRKEALSVNHVATQVAAALGRYDISEGEAPVALAFHDPVGIQYDRLKTFALGLVEALPRTIGEGLPFIIIFDTDVGNSVGNVLFRETGVGNVLSIDEISLSEGDFIDVGESIIGNPVFPVVVKSLIFES